MQPETKGVELGQSLQPFPVVDFDYPIVESDQAIFSKLFQHAIHVHGSHAKNIRQIFLRKRKVVMIRFC